MMLFTYVVSVQASEIEEIRTRGQTAGPDGLTSWISSAGNGWRRGNVSYTRNGGNIRVFAVGNLQQYWPWTNSSTTHLAPRREAVTQAHTQTPQFDLSGQISWRLRNGGIVR